MPPDTISQLITENAGLRERLTELEAQLADNLAGETMLPEGGIAEAVRSALARERVEIYSLSVRKIEMSGTPDELLDYEDIAAVDIVAKVKKLLI